MAPHFFGRYDFKVRGIFLKSQFSKMSWLYIEKESMQTDLKAQIIGMTQEMTTSKLFFDSNIGHTLF